MLPRYARALVDANTKEFIITYGNPHKPASSDTISRWNKDNRVHISKTKSIRKKCWCSFWIFETFYGKCEVLTTFCELIWTNMYHESL